MSKKKIKTIYFAATCCEFPSPVFFQRPWPSYALLSNFASEIESYHGR